MYEFEASLMSEPGRSKSQRTSQGEGLVEECSMICNCSHEHSVSGNSLPFVYTTSLSLRYTQKQNVADPQEEAKKNGHTKNQTWNLPHHPHYASIVLETNSPLCIVD